MLPKLTLDNSLLTATSIDVVLKGCALSSAIIIAYRVKKCEIDCVQQGILWNMFACDNEAMCPEMDDVAWQVTRVHIAIETVPWDRVKLDAAGHNHGTNRSPRYMLVSAWCLSSYADSGALGSLATLASTTRSKFVTTFRLSAIVGFTCTGAETRIAEVSQSRDGSPVKIVSGGS